MNRNSRNYVFLCINYFFHCEILLFISDNLPGSDICFVYQLTYLYLHKMSVSNHRLSNFCIFIFKVCISYKYHITGSRVFIKATSICLLIRAFNLFTFTANTDVFKSLVQLFVFSRFHLFLSLLFLFSCFLLGKLYFLLSCYDKHFLHFPL